MSIVIFRSSYRPLFVLLLFIFLACDAPDLDSPEDTRLVGNYHYVWDYESYDKAVLEIGYRKNQNGYFIVIGPDIKSYGWNEDYIIAKINPPVDDNSRTIDTNTESYIILEMAKDGSDVSIYKNIYQDLTYEEYLEKRQGLDIPDDLTFTINRK